MSRNEGTSLSVIVPYAYRKGDSDSPVRLRRALSCFAHGPRCEVILLEAGSSLPLELDDLLGELESARYVRVPPQKVFSPGMSRNQAVAASSGEWLLFWDADLVARPEFMDTIPGFLATLSRIGPHAFCMFPCLWLTPSGTNVYSHDDVDYLRSFMTGHNHLVDGVALSTCCLLVSRAHFDALGGFDERFSGHGGEDFDLVHRLACHYSAGPRPDDYYVNEKSFFAGNYLGFRSYFARYSLGHLLAGHCVLHQWHKRPVNTYTRKHQGNDDLLYQSMREYDARLSAFKKKTGLHDITSGDVWASQPYSDAVKVIQQDYGWPVKTFPGLFEYAEGVRVRGRGVRKLKKLFREPGKFMSDSRVLGWCLKQRDIAWKHWR
ncbi:galactosyltransferase-related protein [Desulfoluna spongiiphila]|uniref:galactosyltransferase-related protein n=1 Tax=Desulfoluna spongiiphila TaxID=419481 RepID=UPI00299F60AB|nr:galactosyltransferase-related protein [Desulfoluna spongiiphila]